MENKEWVIEYKSKWNEHILYHINCPKGNYKHHSLGSLDLLTVKTYSSTPTSIDHCFGCKKDIPSHILTQLRLLCL